MSEFSPKQDHIRALLEERKLDALLLKRVSSFAWATCGAASYELGDSSFSLGSCKEGLLDGLGECDS